MPHLLNLKAKPIKNPPLIEILGPLDVGKTPIAQLVARRLRATFISFPVLDPTTSTGRGLLAALASSPRGLESHPHWWAHMYAANMYEQASRIEEAILKGPVVVTNYITAYKIWMELMGINTYAFTVALPKVNSAFMLNGDPIAPTTRPKFDFSPDFVLRLKRRMIRADFKIKRVVLSDFNSNFYHTNVNNIAVAITSDINSREGCRVYEKELYSKDSFPAKKD